MIISLPSSLLIDVTVGFKPIDIHHQFPFRHKEVIVHLLHQLQLQSVDIQFRYSPDLRIVLILIKEIVGELGRHHHRGYQQPTSSAVLPVDTILVEHEPLQRLLQTVDVDQRDDEDGAGAVGELEDAWVRRGVRLR
jgi:hypothetical protein